MKLLEVDRKRSGSKEITLDILDMLIKAPATALNLSMMIETKVDIVQRHLNTLRELGFVSSPESRRGRIWSALVVRIDTDEPIQFLVQHLLGRERPLIPDLILDPLCTLMQNKTIEMQEPLLCSGKSTSREFILWVLKTLMQRPRTAPDITRVLQRRNGVVDRHLEALEKFGFVASTRHMRKRVWYPLVVRIDRIRPAAF